MKMINEKEIEENYTQAENEHFAYTLGAAFGLLTVQMNQISRAMGAGYSHAIEEALQESKLSLRERIGLNLISFGNWVGGWDHAEEV